MEKKSERLEVRLGYQEKQDFTDACDTQGDTPSGAVRRFISGYVRRSDSDVLASAWRGAAKRKLMPAFAVIAVLIVLVVGSYGVMKSLPEINADEIFSFRDSNKSGELEFVELGRASNVSGARDDLLRVLDIDASGTISRDEFVRKGRMVYTIGQDKAAKASSENSQRLTLVDFEFTKEKTRVDSFTGAKVKADGLDRLVIWPSDGLPVVMKGRVMIAAEMETVEFQADEVIDYSQRKSANE